MPADRPRRRKRSWPWIVLGVCGGVAVLFALDYFLYGPGRRHATAGPPPLRTFATLAEVPPAEAIPVWLVPHGADAEGLPQVELRLGERTWRLAHPAQELDLRDAHRIWDRLRPEYERVCAAFTDAVRELREADPDLKVGVVRTGGAEGAVSEDVVTFVCDAFVEAGVPEVVVGAESVEPEQR